MLKKMTIAGSTSDTKANAVRADLCDVRLHYYVKGTLTPQDDSAEER